MAGGTGSTGQAAFAGGLLRSGPVALFTRKVPGLRVAACPARRNVRRGAALFLVVAVAGGACSSCWQAVRRANSSAPEKKCITFANLVHNLQTASFEGF